MEHVRHTKLICIGSMFTMTELTECFMERYFDYSSLMCPYILLRMLYSIPVLHLDITYLLTYLLTRLPTGWTVRGSNPCGARFSAPVQTGPEAHPASCTMGTGCFPGVRCCRGVTLTPHPLLAQRSKIE